MNSTSRVTRGLDRAARCAAGLATLLIAGTASAIEVDCTWIAGNGSWSTAGNWDCNFAPTNGAGVEFNVTIPGGVTVVADLSGCTIKRLTLGAGATLEIAAGADLTVTDDTNLNGFLNACGGDFTAVGPNVSLGNQCRLWAKDGSIVTIGATSYSSSGLPFTTTILSADGVGTVLDLSAVTSPSIVTLADVVFALSSGATLLANGPAPATYSSAGMDFSATIMSADGTGTVLDLSAVTSLSAAFNDSSSIVRCHTIQVTGEALIALVGVTSMVTPSRPEDCLSLIVTGSHALLDQSRVRETSGAGDVVSNVADGRWRVGSLCNVAADVDINLNDSAATLDCPESFFANELVDIVAVPNARVEVAGRFCYSHVVEADLDVASAIVQFDGSASEAEPQWMEVGGVDLALLCGGYRNFGMGQLVVGQPGQPTTVALRDDVDNGNQLGNPEALYLWGLGNGESALQIHEGSTLVINQLNVYLCEDGTSISELFGKGVELVEWPHPGGGSIALGTLPVPADIDGDGIVGTSDLLALLGEWGECPDPLIYCPADLDCDGNVGTSDLLILLENWE